MFVIDPDNDSVQIVRDTIKYANGFQIETIQFMTLTPLPGTPVFERMQREQRILHYDWSKYDAHHIVFAPKLMSLREAQVQPLKGMQSFYSWWYSLKWLANSCASVFDRKMAGRSIFYALIGAYGRKNTRQALKSSAIYLTGLIDSEAIVVVREKEVSGC